jgi:site-specific DNA-methyltransferase (adenine-specific)
MEEGRFNLRAFGAEHPAFPEEAEPLDALESWETGRIDRGVFFADQTFGRSFKYPELTVSLRRETEPEAIMTTDAAGRRRAYLRQKS